jgi:oligogalacturonide transport system substrate-binding protein
MRRAIGIVAVCCLVILVAGPLTASGTGESSQVTLRFSWWGGDARHKAILAAIDKYHAKNPNVTITGEYGSYDGYNQKKATELAGGTLPDIVYLTPFVLGEFVQKKQVFTDLKAYPKLIDVSAFDQHFLADFCSYKDNLIGLPTGINAMSILFNKKLVDKYGLDLANGYDWEKFLSEGKKVNQQNKDQYFITGDSLAYQLLMEAYVKQEIGTNLINDDNTIAFDRDSMLKSFVYLQRLFTEKVAEPMEAALTYRGKTQENKKWLSGDIACQEVSSTAFKAFYAPGMEPMAGTWPVLKNGKGTGIRAQPGQVASATTTRGVQNEEAAIRFLNWFFNDQESIMTLADVSGTPATTTGRKILTEAKMIDKVISQAVDLSLKIAAKPENNISENTEIVKIYSDIVEKVAFGKATPEAATDELISAFTKKLDELKAASN